MRTLRRPGAEQKAHAAAAKYPGVQPPIPWVLNDVTHKLHEYEVRNAAQWDELGAAWVALHRADVADGQNDLDRQVKQHELLKRLAAGAGQFIASYILGMHAPKLNYWGVVICNGCLDQGMEICYPCLTVDQVRDGL